MYFPTLDSFMICFSNHNVERPNERFFERNFLFISTYESIGKNVLSCCVGLRTTVIMFCLKVLLPEGTPFPQEKDARVAEELAAIGTVVDCTVTSDPDANHLVMP